MASTSTSAIAAGAAAGLAGAVYCSCASGSSAAEQGLATDSVAAFDMSDYIAARQRGEEPGEEALAVCRAMADYIHRTGILVIRDPRVSSEDNDGFLDLLQRYYAQPREALMEDARPDIHYQVGVTPDNVETAVCASDAKCKAEIAAMSPEHRPLQPTGPDPKWRFFWRIGERPDADKTEFADLNAAPVIPKAFAGEWEGTMDDWGNKVLSATMTVAEMLAEGFGEQRDAFTSRMHLGPHLLAPTGGDLARCAATATASIRTAASS